MAGIGTASVGGATRGTQMLRDRNMRGVAATALLLAMLGLSACGTWADPTSYFGDDEDAPPSATAVSNSPTAVNSDRFPNLARVPPRPVEVSSSGERRQALDNLAADRGNARYTDEELRARPADSNTPPPVPRSPVTNLPSASTAPARPAPVAQAAPAVQAPAAPVAQAPAAQTPAPVAQAPMAQSPANQSPANQPPANQAPAQPANVTDTYSQSLAQSGARTLPSGLAQPGQAGAANGAAYGNGVPLPGSSQLLAIVRFNSNESALGRDDRDLIRKTAEYFKGVGGKGMLRVVGYAPSQAQASMSQRRAEQVSAELRRHGIAFGQIQQDSQIATAAPAYYETAARATDQNRRVEIYIVN